ncbi:hypothetical protein HMN09_01083600 [Mycena chlorophos]|uniref:Uncharacterized protein n=1 Tax=Mycena chlorophos TaxID=658473 RepID=A0A8H6SC12_MYCCL|nr:hypothetical protein HMN09_01083600 [Mycena chlorophos]
MGRLNAPRGTSTAENQSRKSSRKATASRTKFTKANSQSRGSRAQLPRAARARARFLYHECHLSCPDIALELGSSESVVRGAILNKYKEPDDVARDGWYISEEFRAKYIVYRDPTPPPVEPRSSQAEQEVTAKLPARDSLIKIEALEIRMPVHDNEHLDVDMDTEETGPGTLRSSPVSEHETEEDEQRISDEDDGAQTHSTRSPTPSVRDFEDLYNLQCLLHTVDPGADLELQHHLALFISQGLDADALRALPHWPHADARAVLQRLLGRTAARPMGLLEFPLLELQSALHESYRAAGNAPLPLPAAPPAAAPPSVLHFLASPMPHVSLARHHALFLSKGITTVAHLKRLAKRWDTYRDMFAEADPKMSPFESVVLEMGLERLREGLEA